MLSCLNSCQGVKSACASQIWSDPGHFNQLTVNRWKFKRIKLNNSKGTEANVLRGLH